MLGRSRVDLTEAQRKTFDSPIAKRCLACESDGRNSACLAIGIRRRFETQWVSIKLLQLFPLLRAFVTLSDHPSRSECCRSTSCCTKTMISKIARSFTSVHRLAMRQRVGN